MAAPWALVADPGVDDAVAMAVLAGLGAVPDLVVAVPGNVGLASTGRNAAGVAALLGWDVPVRTWDGPVRAREGATHGFDGLGGLAARLPPTAPPTPVDRLPTHLLVTGALSAVGVADQVERLVWMGGAIAGGNVTGVAEFNAWCDPAAVDGVLAEHAGATSIVPLDVTRRVPVTPDDLADGGPVASLLAGAMRSTARDLVHDAVAAVAWLRPDLFEWERTRLRCEPSGQLAPDRDRRPVQIAVDTDVAAVQALVAASVLRVG